METIGSRLARHKGVAPGFDFLRIFLAVSIVAWHTNAIVTGDLSYNTRPFFWVYGYFTLAAFFSLSGFLISGSATRLSLRDFLINRGLRIVPALAVEIVLSALVLGPLFTALPLKDYFGSAQTWHYFSNILGWINYLLPGVFKDHPTDIVNNTLWTVPHEVGCYAIMSALIVFGLLKRPGWIFGFTTAIVGAGLLSQLIGANDFPGWIGKAVGVLLTGKASRLYICFCFGIVCYLLRDRIPYSRLLFGVCLLLTLVVGSLPQPDGTDYPLANLLLALPLSYVTAFIGVTEIPMPRLLTRGDYSYGIYLYGWPIQQTVVALLPQQKSLLVQFGLALPAILLFAAFSWHCIEKPILRLRKRFSFVARVRLENEEAGESPPSPAPITVPQAQAPAR
jgi:peptidoglycan/LPS O-acetylase OafA/YrhL